MNIIWSFSTWRHHVRTLFLPCWFQLPAAEFFWTSSCRKSKILTGVEINLRDESGQCMLNMRSYAHAGSRSCSYWNQEHNFKFVTDPPSIWFFWFCGGGIKYHFPTSKEIIFTLCKRDIPSLFFLEWFWPVNIIFKFISSRNISHCGLASYFFVCLFLTGSISICA